MPIVRLILEWSLFAYKNVNPFFENPTLPGLVPGSSPPYQERGYSLPYWIMWCSEGYKANRHYNSEAHLRMVPFCIQKRKPFL